MWKSKNEWNLDENKKSTETPREENGEMMTWWTKPFFSLSHQNSSKIDLKMKPKWTECRTNRCFSSWVSSNRKHRRNEWNLKTVCSFLGVFLAEENRIKNTAEMNEILKLVCCFLLATAPKNRARGFSPSPQNEKIFLLWWIFSLPQKRKIVVVMSYDDGPYE